jgi:hypothetical protein
MRRGIYYSANPDVTGLDIDPGRELRSDADITLQSAKSPLRILAVHLKTDCFGPQLSGTMRRTCAELRQVAPLARATEGHTCPCWGGEAFIGHIIVGAAARDEIRPNALCVLTYRETGAIWKQHLSDHCRTLAHPRLSALNNRQKEEMRMQITGITTKEFRWPRHKPIANGKHTYTHVTFAVVEIETSDGITGIGLGGGGEIERATVARLTPMLIGEDPIDVERFPRSISGCGTFVRSLHTCRCTNCSAASATACPPILPAATTRRERDCANWRTRWKTMSAWAPRQ